MPGVITIALGSRIPAARLARRMERSGYRIAHHSDYLVERNWVQLCLMGEWNPRAIEILPEVFAANARACVQQRRSGSMRTQGSSMQATVAMSP